MMSSREVDKIAFVARFGSVWEHSPWVAESTWSIAEPDGGWTAGSLHAAMCRVMREGPLESVMQLVRAHPDLAGRLAIANKLTAESATEQASAGLNQLTPDEQTHFLELNERYKGKFGFPFIVAVTGQSKHDILAQFQMRLINDPVAEWNAALHQIETIALLRLERLFTDTMVPLHKH